MIGFQFIGQGRDPSPFVGDAGMRKLQLPGRFTRPQAALGQANQKRIGNCFVDAARFRESCFCIGFIFLLFNAF